MIIDFFKSLFRADSNTDEKVVVGFMSFAMMVIIALCNLFFGLVVPYEIFATFAGLVFGCFGLGTFASIKTSSLKSDVATEVVKNNASVDSNETAQNIQQNTNQTDQEIKDKITE